jgi:hypothetical protein
MHRHTPSSQWVFSLLIEGLPASLAASSPSERVKAYRQLRLKHMVLCALYRDFDSRGSRWTADEGHCV